MRLFLRAGLLALAAWVPLRAEVPVIDLGFGGSSARQVGGHVSIGWAGGYSYQAAKVLITGEFFPPALPEETMLAVSYQAGPYWNRTFAFAAVTAGISVMRFEDRVGPGRPNPDCGAWEFFCPDSIHARRTTVTAGIPVDFLFSLKLWNVGLGIRAWGNANLHRPMAGIGGVLYFGGGPTRARRPPE